MPNPLIGLESGRASVQPGGQARVGFTITNTGTRVEGYDLTVVGPTAPWARVEPSQVSVYPQEPASATVVFSPPAGSSVFGGFHPFAVLARSTLDPTATAVAEGDVEVAKLPGLQARIVPATSSGRWRGQHVVHLANNGNTVAQLQIVPSDPDEAIGFYVSPSTVTLPPGGKATVRLSALGRHPFLRGAAQRLPFEVVGEPAGRSPDAPRPQGPGYGDPSRPVVAGAFNQQPILSRGLVATVLVVLAALLALGFYLQSKPEQAEPVLADRAAPDRPVATVLDIGPTSIRLRWDPVESADGYLVQQRDRPGGDVLREWPRLGSENVFDVPDLPSATPVCFVVYATRGPTRSAESETVCTKTAPATSPSMTAMPSTPTLPDRDPLPNIRAVRAIEAPTIDGAVGDWNEVSSSPASARITTTTTTTTGQISLMWDNEALYLLANVVDQSVKATDPANLTQIYRGDAVVLELGADATLLGKDAPARASDAYYMFGFSSALEDPLPTAPPFPQSTAVVGVLGPIPSGQSFDKPRNPDPPITAVVQRTSQGYIVEAAIPWATTGLGNPGPGAKLAANVVVTDRDQNTYANHAMVSTNRQRTAILRAHPFYWQVLELVS